MRLSAARQVRAFVLGWGIALVLFVLSAAAVLADGGIGPYPK